MPWCPKCKSEYREGFTVCADCGSALVSEEQFDALEKAKELEEAQELAKLSEHRFQEAEDGKEQISDNREGRNQPLYQDSAERASENRSSAWILLAMGSLGLLGAGLGIAGLLPVQFSNPYLIYGVMTAVFLLFIVAGIISVKNAIIFERKAESENSLKDTLLEWCRESLHQEELDQQIGAEEITAEEILYLKRVECIQAKLNRQFMNLDQGFLEKLIEDCVYGMVFEENR